MGLWLGQVCVDGIVLGQVCVDGIVVRTGVCGWDCG